MRASVKIHGLKHIAVTLQSLPASTAKGVLRRILRKRAKPLAAAARHLVPKDTGTLKKSIRIGTKLSRRQRKLHRRAGRDVVELFVGPGPDPAAHLQEFGAQPYMRPAWDRTQSGILDGIKDDLWAEIRKTIARKKL